MRLFRGAICIGSIEAIRRNLGTVVEDARSCVEGLWTRRFLSSDICKNLGENIVKLTGAVRKGSGLLVPEEPVGIALGAEGVSSGV